MFFLCNPWVHVLIWPCWLRYWQTFLLLLFLTHIICHWHPSDVRPCASLSTFLSISLSSPLSIPIIVPSTLKEWLPRCLFLWWNSFCKTWVLEAFSFVWGTLFLSYLLSPLVWWCLLTEMIIILLLASCTSVSYIIVAATTAAAKICDLWQQLFQS